MNEELKEALNMADQESALIKSGEIECSHSGPITILAAAYRASDKATADAVKARDDNRQMLKDERRRVDARDRDNRRLCKGIDMLKARAEKAEASLLEAGQRERGLRYIIKTWREQGLSLWGQFAHYTDAEGRDKYSNMALSVLEDLELALESLGLIDKNGVPNWEAHSNSTTKEPGDVSKP